MLAHPPDAGTSLIDLEKSPCCLSVHRHQSLQRRVWNASWRALWLTRWCTSAVLMVVLAFFSGINLATAQSLPEQGFRIINTGNTGNCIACHALPGQTGLVSTFGPALHAVASRYNPQELRQWVTDARKIKPDTLMPPFGTTQGTNAAVRAQSILSEEQIAHVVAALLTLK